MLTALIDLLFPPRETERLVRTLDASALRTLLYPQTLVTLVPVVMLLPYDDPRVRAAILEAKYHGNPGAAGLLSAVLAAYLDDLLVEDHIYERSPTILIPIPLSRERRRDRGYNQTEVVARLAAVSLPHLSVRTDLIMRTRDTRPQTTLDGKERKRNLKGAFAATAPLDPSAHYFLFDDVVTTGATLHAAAKALRARGARRVDCLALAH